jgi:hypothetical protein
VNRARSFAFFVLFLVCFCSALTFKFQYFVLNGDESNLRYGILCVIILASGIALSLSLKALHEKKPLNQALLQGIILTGFAWVGVTLGETELSRHYYRNHNHLENFSVLGGHCGVHAGRTILKIAHSEDDSSNDGKLKEFEMKDHCRIAHLNYLMNHKIEFCEPSEDPIDCQIRWMSGIAEHGYWNYSTRKFFFGQVMKVWANSKKEESLVNYTLKDQELEHGRQSILTQAGIEETMNERYLLVQEKEELDNLILTRDIFGSVAPMITEAKVSPPPYLFKFKDTQTDVLAKLTKIPELEK